MLSIVTPTFNRAKLLKNCFLSLQRQTNQDFEWIVVDDGSVDDTKAVVASFQEQAPEPHSQRPRDQSLRIPLPSQRLNELLRK